jgi:hypothetical protein
VHDRLVVAQFDEQLVVLVASRGRHSVLALVDVDDSSLPKIISNLPIPSTGVHILVVDVGSHATNRVTLLFIPDVEQLT